MEYQVAIRTAVKLREGLCSCQIDCLFVEIGL